MPQYKLMYFNSRGRAETPRMMLTLAGQEFEDYRFKEGEWPGELKGNSDLFPLGQAPVLLVDGKPIHQSAAINCYLAREFGFYGSFNAEATKIDEIAGTVEDIIYKSYPIFLEQDESKKPAIITKFREEDSKLYLTYLNSEIKAAGGRFFVGDKESLADFGVYGILDFFIATGGEEYLTRNYPDLAGFHKGITENSRLSDYIKSRPKTNF